jgi:hypothetical protein
VGRARLAAHNARKSPKLVKDHLSIF